MYVARPLSYKTKTGQAKTKTAFFKAIKLLTQDHWRSQKFWWEGFKLEILWRYFGDVMANYILKFDFVIISFKNHYLVKSRNFRSLILKI